MIEIRCTKSMGGGKQCRKVCAVIKLESFDFGITETPIVESVSGNGWTQAEPWPDEYEPDGTIVVGCHKHGAFLTLPQRESGLEAIVRDPKLLADLRQPIEDPTYPIADLDLDLF